MSPLTRTRALFIQRTLGTRCAAGFLRNRGIDLATALWLLAGATIRNPN